jgi:hypothetical protein
MARELSSHFMPSEKRQNALANLDFIVNDKVTSFKKEVKFHKNATYTFLGSIHTS